MKATRPRTRSTKSTAFRPVPKKRLKKRKRLPIGSSAKSNSSGRVRHGRWRAASRPAHQLAETNMTEPLFLYGVYSIHVRPLALQGARWDAEYEIRHNDH